MPGLHLYTSNRLEELFAELAQIVARPLPSVFDPEIVVVQSSGMGRWLSLRLGEARGICANVQFPFPQKFIAEIFTRTLPEIAPTDAFAREILPWRIMRLLPTLAERDEFEAVRHYLSGERPALKLYQLSVRIAEVFDRYLVFRPRMILDWDAGQDRQWQAILWRELGKETPSAHLPALGLELAKALRTKKKLPELPQRVSLFGFSTLPKFYLQILQELSQRMEIHLFVMQPTPEWWHDLVSPRQKAKTLQRHPGKTAAELHLETGNQLLAAMGKLGRDFLHSVADLQPNEYKHRFVLPAEETLLAQVQREIFQLENHDTTRPIAPNDRSILFHSCHSEMREMEILHDQLLDAFASNQSLQPKDIVVMMPDVAKYAPFIDAVFATPEAENVRIPYTIADRTTRAESSVVDTFLALLDLARSRFGASEVMNVLEAPAVQQRFNLAESDLDLIRDWLGKAAIRWGIDEKHRAQVGAPEFAQNSWRAGLDRLLLGYALPARGRQLFHDILPIDDIEGDLAETLGNLIEFVEALFEAAIDLRAARPLIAWQNTLRQIVGRFFASNDVVERELLQVRRVLDSLGEVSIQSRYAAGVPFDVLLAHLQGALGDADAGGGFLVGRVTFCTLKPMRSLPFRAVFLVGMNDTAFPRKSPALSFDLIAQYPQPGDRFRRDDDRYLFLEALLSARDSFSVSYVGQSIRDNSVIPPSVLVSELIDYLGGEERLYSLVTRHKLQPFNPAYFDRSSGLFSYSQENYRASLAAIAERQEPVPFIDAPLADPEELSQQIDLADLLRFFRSPVKFFLQNRLGIRLPNEESMLEEREPFSLSGLAKYGIDQELFRLTLAEIPVSQRELLVRASGQFPPGLAGEVIFRESSDRADLFTSSVRDQLSPYLPAQIINLSINDWKLSGRIDRLTNKGLLFYRFAKIKPFDLLQAWICHLMMNCSEAVPTRLLAEDETYRFPPIEMETCNARLNALLNIYARGHGEPLPFFPKTSLAFAAQTVSSGSASAASNKVREQWDGNRQEKSHGEKDDPYIALAFRNVPDPLDETWAQLALEIFEPILRAREEL